MKFDISVVPSHLKNEVEVGNVYKALGGARDTAFWVIVSRGQTMCHCLGISREGVVVSTTSYSAHVFEQRPVVGTCWQVREFCAAIAWNEK